jgi:small subunit ribosomal protein S20
LPSKKTARVQERKRVRMAPLRTRAKSFVSKARHLMESSEIEAAETAVGEAIVALDKAAQKGALHQNNASRRKSRLMKQLDSAKTD